MEGPIYNFKTLTAPSEVILHKDRKSKFYGYAFPISSENAIKPILENIRKQYPMANHVCYAWRLGIENVRYRANDDGEPTNSAGMPIYGQLNAFGVTNTLVIVVRVFGGTKLGVGGLIQAYRTAARLTLEKAKIVERQITIGFELLFPYSEMDVVMRTIKKHQVTIDSQEMNLDCKLIISIPKEKHKKVVEAFGALHKVSIKKTG
ncbi:IMPACT family protein [Allomuricauda sp. SCSIO 65647]|uniref:IMPACT family protein n=1 Tax=Allomuricauda sp. SCSIO 65647 TaxID=2908843 RepID=UPI001F260B9F|nr:YigZ family protein [Muricauda sp. SCSIO 65647]UJH67617.1 YigZ family protein [Muricauda sp. SCSIO 65647]